MAGRPDEYGPYMRRNEENHGIFQTTVTPVLALTAFLPHFQTPVFEGLYPSVLQMTAQWMKI